MDLAALEVDLGAVGVDLGALVVDPGALGADLGALGVDLGALGVDLGVRGVDLGARAVGLGVRGVDLGVRGVDLACQRGREPWNISTRENMKRARPRRELNSIQLYLAGVALQGNSRHTAPGGRYVICPREFAHRSD